MVKDNKDTLRNIDQGRLHLDFYFGYDQTKIKKKIQTILVEPSRFQNSIIGSGSHFCAYQLEGIQGRNSLHYVASIGHRMQEPEGTFWVERFYLKLFKAMRFIPQIQLVPPFELFQLQNNFVIVTPLGIEKESSLAHWEPLNELILIFESKLHKAGLILRDSLQLRYYRGVPFIYDFSGLEILQD